MKRIILGLMALTFAACELEIGVNRRDVVLSDISIECIAESEISNNTSANNEPFTKHTYLCKGYIGGFRGECEIRVMNNNHILYKHEVKVAGSKIPFEFTFAPEWAYLDEPYNNFTLEVVDDDDDLLCQTTIVVTKHPEEPVTTPTDTPYMEYSLWDTQCDWQLPNQNNSVIIVNSDEELARYITSEGEGDYPSVDFAKYTMIIAYGYTTQGVYDTVIKSLEKSSEREYTLNIDVVTRDTDAPERWTKALLVDKWDRVYNVNLNVDVIQLIN